MKNKKKVGTAATFTFTPIEPKKSCILNGSKVMQENDLTVNVLKENMSFFENT